MHAASPRDLKLSATQTWGDVAAPWLVLTSIVGLILAGLGSLSAIGHLEMMGSMFGIESDAQPTFAQGAYTALFAYALLLIAPFTQRQSP